jgi:SAM-dependent methyltransferase
VTDAFLDALPLRRGARVLDVGCGPGLVLADLRARVGAAGSVVGIDESERWIGEVAALAGREGWGNVRAEARRVPLAGPPEGTLEGGPFDLVFLRWVLAFLPERERVLTSLARVLRPGGTLAVMDYNHEGLSLFPRSAGFEAMVRALRARYTQGGGDVFLMGTIPALFRAAGLEPAGLTPWVLAGGPGSPAFRWADAFFPHHSAGMLAAGLLSAAERELFLSEWAERRADRDALFFSPLVVTLVARRPDA